MLAIVLNTFLSGTLSSMFCNLTFKAVKINTQKGLQLYFLVFMNIYHYMNVCKALNIKEYTCIIKFSHHQAGDDDAVYQTVV